jgi:hypothetical protein
MGNEMELTTKRMREIADLDSRAGAPVGCALCAAADRIDGLEAALRRITRIEPDPYSKSDLYTARRIAKEAL